jgi:hypothetical protein
MALAYIAFCSGHARPWRRQAAKSVLAIALIFNLCTRLFEPALYYGVAYLGSLLVLAALFIESCGTSFSGLNGGAEWIRTAGTAF